MAQKEHMKEVLHQIKEYVAPAQTVVIEAGHIYADKVPGLEQQAGAIWASEILVSLSQTTHRTLLIDDIHIVNATLDVGCYTLWLAKQGYPVDEIILESILKPESHQLLAKIKEIIPPKKIATSKTNHGSEGLWTEAGKVPLLVSGQPSCCLLDAALYLKKFQTGEYCVTVLPFTGDQKYVEQQQLTLALLKKVKPDFQVVNIFFNPHNFKEDFTLMVNGGIKQ